jgi:4-hydroxyphenylpyruvate dioxygenase
MRFSIAPAPLGGTIRGKSALRGRLRALDILYDQEPRNACLQVFTSVFAERFFFDIVERRDGYVSFGAPAEPSRRAARSFLARGPGIPRG